MLQERQKKDNYFKDLTHTIVGGARTKSTEHTRSLEIMLRFDVAVEVELLLLENSVFALMAFY